MSEETIKYICSITIEAGFEQKICKNGFGDCNLIREMLASLEKICRSYKAGIKHYKSAEDNHQLSHMMDWINAQSTYIFNDNVKVINSVDLFNGKRKTEITAHQYDKDTTGDFEGNPKHLQDIISKFKKEYCVEAKKIKGRRKKPYGLISANYIKR